MDSEEKTPKVQTVAGHGDMKEPSAVTDEEDISLKWDDSDCDSPVNTLNENDKLDNVIQSQNKALSIENKSFDDKKLTENEKNNLENIEKAEVSNEGIEDIDEDELLKLTPDEKLKKKSVSENSLPEDMLLDTSNTSEKVENNTLNENDKLDNVIQSQNKALSIENKSFDVKKLTENLKNNLESIEKAEVSNEGIEDIDEDELLKLTPDEELKKNSVSENSLPEDMLLDTSNTSEKVENISNKKDEPIVLETGDGMLVESCSENINKDELNNVDNKSISEQIPDSIQSTEVVDKNISDLDSNKLKNNDTLKSSADDVDTSKIIDSVSDNSEIMSLKDESVKSDVKVNETLMQIDENPHVIPTEDKVPIEHLTSINIIEKKLEKQTTLDLNVTKEFEVEKEEIRSDKDETIPKIHDEEVPADQSELGIAKNNSETTLENNERISTENILITHKNEIKEPLNPPTSKDADDESKDLSNTSEKDHLKKSGETEKSNDEIKMNSDEIKSVPLPSEAKVMTNPDETDKPDNVLPLKTDNTTADALDESMSELSSIRQENSKDNDDVLTIEESVNNLNEGLGLNEIKPDTVLLSSAKDLERKSTDEINKKTSDETLEVNALGISMDSEKTDNDTLPECINEQDNMEVELSTDGNEKIKPETSSNIASVAHSEDKTIQNSSVTKNQIALKCDVLEAEKVKIDVNNHDEPKVIKNPDNEVTFDKPCEITKVTDKASIDENNPITPSTSNDEAKVVEKDSMDIDTCDNTKFIDKSQDEITKVIEDNDQVSTETLSDVTKPANNEKGQIDISIAPIKDQIKLDTTDNISKDKAVKEDPTDIPKINDEKSENQDQMTPDASDEIPKVTDSLGLLTESSRVVEEDDEQEAEDEEENDEDDDDYDHDEESTQIPLDQSEDSNDPVTLKEKIESISTDDDISSDANNVFDEISSDANHVLITSEENLDTNDGCVEEKHEISTLSNSKGTDKLSVETRQATSFLEDMLRGKRKDSTDADDETSNKKQKTDGDTISLPDAIKPLPPTEDEAYAKIQSILAGVRNMTPLLDLDIEKVCEDLVEISDSDSDNENDNVSDDMKIGQKGAKMLEEVLADTINDVWKRFDLDDRLQNAKDDVLKQLEHVEAERKQIDDMLRDCQRQTDALRTQVYRMFAPTIKTLPSIDIIDTPTVQATKVHSVDSGEKESEAHRRPRPARPHYKIGSKDDTSQDDEVCVVRLGSSPPPPGLPPAGRVSRPPLVAGVTVYAMRHAFGSWLRATIAEVYSNGATTATAQFTAFRVKFVHKVKSPVKQISGRHIAYTEPPSARLTIGARVIALCKDTNTKKEAFFSGIIAEIPNPVNNYRYLVFFDDGYAQYVRHEQTRLVYECSSSVWEEVHPFSMEFVRKYLVAYPERPMVRLHAGQSLKAEWNGKWWDTVVMQVDASLVQVYFKEDNHSEWIYRGSTRLAPLYVELAAKGRPRAHRATANNTAPRKNVPYVEYTRDQDKVVKANEPATRQLTPEPKRDKQAEKVSISVNDQPPLSSNKTNDNVISRVVYFTPKAAVKPYKMTPHKCSTQCKRTDVLPLKELKTYNPLSKPLLSGWERQLVRSTGRKRVIYRSPCGRRLRNMDELHYYLRTTNSEMGVDLFDFSPTTHCLAEFELKRCHVSKKDLSLGKELVPVPCVNYYDQTLPEFCVYNTQRTPTAGVPLNLDSSFLCGCDCTDDCKDKSKCACWKMTIEGAATIGMDTTDVGYVYKRLLDPVPSGIYECNSRCKCKSTCLNRVAQHPLQLKLQVFKTLNRGWGIRALNDVPRGAFICVYVGNLLTDATANLDGLNEGDEYLAELDYIEVVEQMKQDYEEDIPKRDRILDKKALDGEDEDETSSEEEQTSTNDTLDDDFQPDDDDLVNFDKSAYKKSLRKRQSKNTEEKKKEKEKKGSGDDCITISDDEEVREPSSFSAPTDMRVANFVPKYKSVRSHFGEDEAVYTMDAKVQGNIGRYLNHSCSPNVFVQNVFVDTHDPRFPWVAFFALSYVRAGTELTWNYNYDIGSVKDKVLYCYCGAPNCRGRLL